MSNHSKIPLNFNLNESPSSCSSIEPQSEGVISVPTITTTTDQSSAVTVAGFDSNLITQTHLVTRRLNKNDVIDLNSPSPSPPSPPSSPSPNFHQDHNKSSNDLPIPSFVLEYQKRVDRLSQPVQLIPITPSPQPIPILLHDYDEISTPPPSGISGSGSGSGSSGSRRRSRSESESDNNKYDGRTHSKPHSKYGPYSCPHPECKHLVFSTSQAFAAHVAALHYASETAQQRKARQAARFGDNKPKLSLGYTPAGLSVIPNKLNSRPLRLGGTHNHTQNQENNNRPKRFAPYDKNKTTTMKQEPN